ncbi:MAG: hypothetical protein JJT95_06460 [Pararhodobacter sp.]|nr:hypothetical protein [Pararhodobacter sp.]
MKTFRHMINDAVPITMRPRPTAFAAELDYEREIAASRHLALFRRNAATWELLLLLAGADEIKGTGVYQTVENVRSKALGASALLKFIREQNEAGRLRLQQCGTKRSKRLIRLNEALLAELTRVMSRRNAALLQGPVR